MDLKGAQDQKEMVRGYGSNSNNTTLFGSESSDLVDRHRHDILLLQNQSPPSQDQLPDSAQRVRHKPPGSSFKALSLTAPTATARYRECLRNHAASAGGNVLDGCGEFMPAGDDGTIEALKCAACNCHRNFHRKESDSSVDIGFASMVHPLQLPLPLPSPSVKQNSRHWNPSIVPPVKMAFGGGGGSGGAESSSEDLNFNAYHSGAAAAAEPPPFVLSKKRFRTKFTQEQKDKMLEFAEKVGWRIPREDDPEAQRFCAETGVKRHVLKVWMHNNKSAKKAIQAEERE